MKSSLLKAVLPSLAAGIIVSCGGGSGTTQQAPPPPQGSNGTYYVDCSAATNGNATQASPWNTLSGANTTAFVPGNQLLLKRGMTCQGSLSPRGSGSSSAPIVIDTYGSGAQPIIDGGMNNAAITLMDRQYWEIRNLEIMGGNRYGIFIGGNASGSTLNHLHLINLNVHGAHFTSITTIDSGEIFISPAGVHELLNDVLIDGVTAHDSHVSEGIFVEAGGDFNTSISICQQGNAQQLGSGVTIQNSTVHDVYGDGILLISANNGVMQDNVVYNSGLCPFCGTNGGSAPSGLWEFCCPGCAVQGNESYANQTWSTLFDGGDFDMDAYNSNNVLQYNYGHDSAGYCAIIIGTSDFPDTGNIFRYNICSNNARSTTGSVSSQGDVAILGVVDGVQIYNNTFNWNPTANAAAFRTAAIYQGTSPRFFKNNIIYSAVPVLIEAASAFTLDNNIYWTTSTSAPQWQWNGTTYTSFSSFQAASGQDVHGFYTDPLLNNPTYHSPGKPTSAFTLQPGSPAQGTGADVCIGINGCSVGTQDFFGNPLPSGTGYNIGAD